MQSSQFNVRVPQESGDVFLLNTFTDAQLVVSPDVASLLDSLEASDRAFTPEEREALATLGEHGFIVGSRSDERQKLEAFFNDVREDTEEISATVLTTMQCNFACDYCIQGDHGDYNKTAAKMTLATAARVAESLEGRMDATAPRTFRLTLFGGEPLLNLPACYFLAERLWQATQARGIRMTIFIVTNGLLLTPEVVDRLEPFGLRGVKLTLDGDRDTHNRMRPLRGGQGTFDKIIANLRRIAGRVVVTIGGNFDESSVDSYPALIEFLAAQDFAPQISRVNFKPIIRDTSSPSRATTQTGKAKFFELAPVGASSKALGGTCMTTAGKGTTVGSSGCDSCGFASEKMAFLRDVTRDAGFATSDGVHMGPCEIHKKHAYTIGPDGDLYACPGFTGDKKQSTGHIAAGMDPIRSAAARRFEQLSAWRQCDGCPFIPVCAGGCTVASYNELGDVNAPSCHKKSFEAGVATMARDAAASLLPVLA